MNRGSKLDNRPEGLLLAVGAAQDSDGWQYTRLARQEDGHEFIKRQRFNLIKGFEAEFYEVANGHNN